MAYDHASFSDSKRMIFQLMLHLVCLMLDILAVTAVPGTEKALEIAFLCQRLRILERKASAKVHLSRPKKLMFGALTNRLKAVSAHSHNR